MSQQHSHTTTPFTPKQYPIYILCDGLQSPANMGALFRIADAFGVEQIVFCGAEVLIKSSRLRRTSRNTHENVPYIQVEDLTPSVVKLEKEGYEVIALEITQASIPLQKFETNPNQKIALVIGNEKNGISQKLLELCNKQVHIEMHGENSSMNVVQATSIALYALTLH